VSPPFSVGDLSRRLFRQSGRLAQFLRDLLDFPWLRPWHEDGGLRWEVVGKRTLGVQLLGDFELLPLPASVTAWSEPRRSRSRSSSSAPKVGRASPPTASFTSKKPPRPSRRNIAESVVCGPDPERHRATIKEYVDAGYDHVYVHQIGPDQEGFLEFYERELLPGFS
jgi:hypothetical protein